MFPACGSITSGTRMLNNPTSVGPVDLRVQFCSTHCLFTSNRNTCWTEVNCAPSNFGAPGVAIGVPTGDEVGTAGAEVAGAAVENGFHPNDCLGAAALIAGAGLFAVAPTCCDCEAKYGTPTTKRIYADWTRPNAAGWKGVLLEHAITPVQQYSYTAGKNSSDSALIIDAMDLLYQGKVDGFGIMSSDSDFTPLAMRLKQDGLLVYGFGRATTPEAFQNACTRFLEVEKL